MAGFCRAQGQSCEWRESRPDTVGALHDFHVECVPTGTSYTWDFGDGTKTVSPNPSIGHRFGGAGQYLILVRVAMPDGDTLSVVGGQTVYRPLTPGKRLLGDLEVTPSARGLAITHDGKRILVTRFLSGPEAGEIVEVDAASFTVARRYPLAYDHSPDTDISGSGVPNAVNCVAITPDGREAWFTAKKDNVGRGLVRDGRAFNEENTVRTLVGILGLSYPGEDVSRRRDLDNRNMAKAIAFSPNGVLAFVATEGSNAVDIFNVPGSDRIGSLQPNRNDQELAPQGLVVHPDGNLLFVQYFTSREVGVYDISTAGGFNTFDQVDLIKTVDTDSLAPQEVLGQQVFYNSADVRMTRSDYLSCSTCHLDGASEERVWDFTERGEGLRNTTTLLGKGGPGGGPFHLSANFDEVQDFEHDIRGPQRGLGFLAEGLFAQGTRGTPLGDRKSGLSVELDALSAFINTLVHVPASPYRAADGGLTPGDSSSTTWAP